MQDSLTSLNQFKNKLFIFSFGLGLASTVAVFQPNTTVKEIGKSLLGFSIAGIVIGELVTSKAFTFYGKDAEELNKAINSKTKENNEVTRNLDKLTNELKTTKTQSEQLAVQLSKARGRTTATRHRPDAGSNSSNTGDSKCVSHRD